MSVYMCRCILVLALPYSKYCTFLGVLFMFLIVKEKFPHKQHLSFQVALSNSVLQILPHENSLVFEHMIVY